MSSFKITRSGRRAMRTWDGDPAPLFMLELAARMKGASVEHLTDMAVHILDECDGDAAAALTALKTGQLKLIKHD